MGGMWIGGGGGGEGAGCSAWSLIYHHLWLSEAVNEGPRVVC